MLGSMTCEELNQLPWSMQPTLAGKSACSTQPMGSYVPLLGDHIICCTSNLFTQSSDRRTGKHPIFLFEQLHLPVPD